MFFSKIQDKDLQEAILQLKKDEVFLHTLKMDEELHMLDEEQNECKRVFPELCSTVGLKVKIEGDFYSPVKLLPYCFLWAIESPLLRDDNKDVTMLDLELFFYLLDHEVETDMEALIKKASGELQRRNLTYDKAFSVVKALLQLAFSPLKMLPQRHGGGKQDASFDADTLTDIASKVHEMTGFTVDDVMNKMSLTACCFYYVQWAKKQGMKNIEKITDEELMKRLVYRYCELITDRLIELNKLPKEERENFIHLISTPPENK
jgi:hypothetical protein